MVSAWSVFKLFSFWTERVWFLFSFRDFSERVCFKFKLS